MSSGELSWGAWHVLCLFSRSVAIGVVWLGMDLLLKHPLSLSAQMSPLSSAASDPVMGTAGERTTSGHGLFSLMAVEMLCLLLLSLRKHNSPG